MLRALAAPSRIACAALVGAGVLLGCGGRPSSGEGVGTSGEIPGTVGAEAPVAAGAIELTLRRADGTFLEVGELRGAVTLLYVFATFDGASQMLLTPLRDVAERHPDVHFVGIAAQPGARMLIDAYEHALSPPFPLAYDPEDTVVAGTSALGTIVSVPLLIAIDAEGREVRRHEGFLPAQGIEELLRAAGAR